MTIAQVPSPFLTATRLAASRPAGPRLAVLADYQYRTAPGRRPTARVIAVRGRGSIRQLWDEPRSGTAARYLIEPAAHELPDKERDAIVAEYLRHADQIGRPPMMPESAIVVPPATVLLAA